MISFTETKAQQMSLEYLEQHIRPGKVYYVGGHSKGANEVLYAAALLSERKKAQLQHLYINDGPGFCKEVQDPKLIESIDPISTAIRPEYCVIGDKLFLNELLTFFSREQQDIYTPAAPTAEIPTEAWRGYWICAYVDVDATAYPASLLNDKTDLYLEGTSAILGGPVLCDIQVEMESTDGALVCTAEGITVTLRMQQDNFLRMTMDTGEEAMTWYLRAAGTDEKD